MHLLINTGGGDAQGLNAVIRGVVMSALRRGWKVTGIKRGYRGLLEDYPHGLMEMTRDNVRGIAHLGGTILGTVNKGHPFEYPVVEDGKTVVKDVSDTVIQRIREIGGDGLIAIGGDGSLRIAQKFMEKGLKVIGVPKTIDNDLSATDYTFGFESAVTTAVDALDKLHTTAESHHRVMLLEVMGRYTGWIALQAGIAGGADVIVIPEIPYDIKKIITAIKKRRSSGKSFSIIVVAEGAKPLGGDYTIQRVVEGSPDPQRLGGVSHRLAHEIEELTTLETRVTILGHLQRGGSPTAFDRLLASRYGTAAVQCLLDGKFGCMTALHGSEIVSVPLAMAIGELKTVPIEGDLVQTAKNLGISFGK